MQDFKWTDESVLEFINNFKYLAISEGHLQEFKSSKSPKKEWEIVAYMVAGKDVYYTEFKDDIGRIYKGRNCSGSYMPLDEVNNPASR